jgi:hypothetical protein
MNLKSSEKRLLLMFGVLAFLFVNGYAYVKINERHQSIKKEVITLAGQISRGKVLERALPEIQVKRDWLTKNMVVPRSEDQLLTFLVEEVEAQSSNAGVEYAVTPRPRGDTDVAVVTVVDAKIKGNLQQVIELLYALQRPSKFRNVTQFKLVPNRKDPSVITVDLRVEQWWSIDSLAVLERSASAADAGEPTTAGGDASGANKLN